MTRTRSIAAAVAILVAVGLAVLGVAVHYGLTAEYGDVTGSAVENFLFSFWGGVGSIALVIVVVAALVAAALAPNRWSRLVAAAVPVLMLVAMLAVTPMAIRTKLDVQYDAVPRCVSVEPGEQLSSPYLREARASQRAFGSIEHAVRFGGGGSSGVGGCDTAFVVVDDDVDVLGHYQEALPAAGWRVIEAEDGHIRAVRGSMAFELALCAAGAGHGAGGEGVVWAGRASGRPQARC